MPRRLERLICPRCAKPFEATKRLVGFIILRLCAKLLAPIPFNHVIPIFVNRLLALALLKEYGVLQCISLFAAAVSLTDTVATVWGTIEVSLLL